MDWQVWLALIVAAALVFIPLWMFRRSKRLMREAAQREERLRAESERLHTAYLRQAANKPKQRVRAGTKTSSAPRRQEARRRDDSDDESPPLSLVDTSSPARAAAAWSGLGGLSGGAGASASWSSSDCSSSSSSSSSSSDSGSCSGGFD